MANCSVSLELGVCVKCELVPGTQALGCHVELDCQSGVLTEQDFFTSSIPPTASGCLLPVLTTPTTCTLLFYDIEQDESVSIIPAVNLSGILLPSIHLQSPTTTTMGVPTTTTMDVPTTSIPNETGK